MYLKHASESQAKLFFFFFVKFKSQNNLRFENITEIVDTRTSGKEKHILLVEPFVLDEFHHSCEFIFQTDNCVIVAQIHRSRHTRFFFHSHKGWISQAGSNQLLQFFRLSG